MTITIIIAHLKVGTAASQSLHIRIKFHISGEGIAFPALKV